MISELFYSQDRDKQTLHRRITPSDDQREEQKQRWNELRDHLIKDLSENLNLVITSWLQGSYKFGTQIRPRKGRDFDIDLGVYVDWDDYAENGDVSAKQLKSAVQESLKKYRPDGDESVEVLEPPKNRCSRIKFENGFHIDVPVYHLYSEAGIRSLATEDNKWEVSDAVALVDWFRNKFKDKEERFLIRRVIRYYKTWASLNFEEESQPSSIMFTVLVSEAYSHNSDIELYEDNAYMQDIHSKILSRIASERIIQNPIDANEDINRLDDEEWEYFLEKMYELNDLIVNANQAGTEIESISYWQDVFQHFFPSPEVEENSVSKSIIPVNFLPIVEVSAECINNQNINYSGSNKIGPIPRGCKIAFTLVNANELPSGAVIKWTARNEGEEAEYENDMGHKAGFGAETLDASAYNGNHFMDVMISSQYGTVLGFTRVPVFVSNTDCPSRNPRRPRYPRNNRRH